MVNVSSKAEDVLKEYFKDKEISPIRIFLQSGGCCGGPSLAMALDEQKDKDQVFKINGFTMLVDDDLMKMAKGITVDFVDSGTQSGFTVTTEAPIGGGGSCGTEGGGCGSGCSC
jgi:iron-sulfur cluster assembly protein